MPHYKLYYFGVRGLGESIRYLFAAADINYEEELIPFKQWAGEVKPTMTPFHSMPVLVIDHKERIGQHIAISRYLAKSFGMAGKDAIEQAKADMYVDGTNELYGKLAEPLGLLRGSLFSGKDTSEAYAAIKKWCDETLKPWLTLYTGFLEANPTKSGWFVGNGVKRVACIGNGVTYADLYIGEFLTRIQMWNKDAIKDHPKMQALLDKVHSIPGIAKRVQNRADSLSKAWDGPLPPL